jgi:hypothetical protein
MPLSAYKYDNYDILKYVQEKTEPIRVSKANPVVDRTVSNHLRPGCPRVFLADEPIQFYPSLNLKVTSLLPHCGIRHGRQVTALSPVRREVHPRTAPNL